MSLRNRRSPSGAATEVQLPIPGTNALVTGAERSFLVGGIGTEVAPFALSQAPIPETGVLTKVTIQNVGSLAGVLADLVTYKVYKNGVLIQTNTLPVKTATGTLAADSTEPLVIHLDTGDMTPVVVNGPTPSRPAIGSIPARPAIQADRIMVTATVTLTGAAPAVAVVVGYEPGGPL